MMKTPILGWPGRQYFGTTLNYPCESRHFPTFWRQVNRDASPGATLSAIDDDQKLSLDNSKNLRRAAKRLLHSYHQKPLLVLTHCTMNWNLRHCTCPSLKAI